MNDPLDLSIKGMHCGSCVRRVTTTLSAMEGVSLQTVEIGSATMRYDAQRTALNDILACLESIGFTAEVV